MQGRCVAPGAFSRLRALLLFALSALACSGAGGGAPQESNGLPPPFGERPQGSDGSTPVAPRAGQGGPDTLFDAQDLAAPERSAAEGCGPNLTGVLRDFRDSHPDFGDAVADDRGLVQDRLGP